MKTKVPIEPCYYPDYLKLDQLLGAQSPLSAKYAEENHDEMLFIIIHQAYELWFKQIIHEIKRVQSIFDTDLVQEERLGTVLSSLYRINSIFKLLIDQMNVMGTLSPESFLDFRDYLVPASGFQSYQFRELEIRLGLETKSRVKFDTQSFEYRLDKKEKDHLMKVEAEETNLVGLLNQWLERLPFLEFQDFNFWTEYQNAVTTMLDNDEKIIQSNSSLGKEEVESQQRELKLTQQTFDLLFDDKKYQLALEEGKRKISRKATLAALFIKLYGSQPILNTPSRIIAALVDIDESLTTWRYRHALLAHKMLGTKIGTGGSAGHQYLRKTTMSNRIFTDLFNLSTFLLPQSALPVLPEKMKKSLGFQFEMKD